MQVFYIQLTCKGRGREKEIDIVLDPTCFFVIIINYKDA